ncbi:UDP-glucose 4-epimerase GalE [Rickettsiella grylli]|uniref:UDP-glucose 4-epimerase n=1 Tax=Rickettsiella grylli TaxID=59196 RepID=A8PPB1_9COXI|nr:UDP-glucose 4-epimerase GalE [Rickettsiella grylli]EDP46722.1 UDP-glucose 4-epimerase [Rickettsiella grylli]
MPSVILVTGGTGFIGSHVCVAFANAGYNIVILDNLRNSYFEVVDRLECICKFRLKFIEGDILDSNLLDHIFFENNISAVIHLAGLKAVSESIKNPLKCYNNNVEGTLTLINAMRKSNVKKLIFSSSAAVYGEPKCVPIRENFPLSPINPYARSKLMVENILTDLHHAEPDWHIVCLRYFNPVGAHESGLIGEDPKKFTHNLMPYLTQVAIGRSKQFNIFGGNYPTVDGTAIRDYIHVMDLAEGHVAALSNYTNWKRGVLTVNLSTGKGLSVLEVLRAFTEFNQCKIAYRILDRRPGDVAECWADPTNAQRILNWKARRSLAQICKDSWRWQKANPNGYLSH